MQLRMGDEIEKSIKSHLAGKLGPLYPTPPCFGDRQSGFLLFSSVCIFIPIDPDSFWLLVALSNPPAHCATEPTFAGWPIGILSVSNLSRCRRLVWYLTFFFALHVVFCSCLPCKAHPSRYCLPTLVVRVPRATYSTAAVALARCRCRCSRCNSPTPNPPARAAATHAPSSSQALHPASALQQLELLHVPGLPLASGPF